MVQHHLDPVEILILQPDIHVAICIHAENDDMFLPLQRADLRW